MSTSYINIQITNNKIFTISERSTRGRHERGHGRGRHKRGQEAEARGRREDGGHLGRRGRLP